MIDDSENTTSNPRVSNGVATISDIVNARLSRRGFLSGLTTLTALSAAACASTEGSQSVTDVSKAENLNAPLFTFEEIARGSDGTHHLPSGYTGDILLKWGDAIFPDSPEFDPHNQSEQAQLKQFGYNNDYLGYIPIKPEQNESNRGLLCVNHEYTSTNLMLPNVAGNYPDSMTKELCEIELAGHGGSVVEIFEQDGQWHVDRNSKFNRRITAHKTPMEITGPAAGSTRLKTGEDPEGRLVAGTMNNCAGGITPWGTWLMSEENFNGSFLGQLPEEHSESQNHKRYGVPGGWYQWGKFIDRYDVSKEPNEPNRFGWIVEVNPFDPTSKPKKRTALGRFKHEGAENIISPNGRIVVYMGDDQRFDYVYKFVSDKAYDASNKAANFDLLDSGILYVARFDEDGSVEWMPLVYGTGPLTEENGFASQADVLIETRRAADLLEATPMDRPEDVEPDPNSGKVYVMLTNNHKRVESQVNAANPRADNQFGHIIEITEPDGDFTSTKSKWEILIKCGDPSSPAHGSTWNPLTSPDGWFGSPDNCAIDPSGRLWVSTDGNNKTGAADGLWAVETQGPRRGTSRAFFRTPVGAEMCGPQFTPDGKTLFLAVQHPGDEDDATFENPATRWPDFEASTPPRPSVIAIRNNTGKPIGS